MSKKRRSKSCGEWSPKSVACSSTPEFVKRNVNNRRVDFNGEGFYEGDLLDGKREGKGKLFSPSGKLRFDGHWQSNSRNGYGISKYEGGDRHEDNYENNERHGLGVFLWADGDKYVGNFDRGVIHGHGRYEWNDGNIYVGDWQRGQMTGEGFLLKYNAQEELRGHFSNGLLHGWGKKQWSNGNSYEGHFRQGIPHGYGTMIVANNPHHLYEGMWQDDTLAGAGRFVIYNKDRRGRTKQTICVGHFPAWPAKVSVMHVTWLYTSGDHSNTDTSVVVDTITATTTTEEEDNGPESGFVDTIGYIGEASHHDIEFVDDHTVHLLRTWSATSETAHGADSAALSSDRTQNGHNQETNSYGRIEYSDGLVYEGECCTMQPHGWGVLYNPKTNDMPTSLSNMPPSEILSPVERLQRRHRILEEDAAATIDEVMHLSDRDFAAIIDLLPPDVVRRRLSADDLMGIRCLLRYRGGYWMGSFHHGQVQFNAYCTLSLGEEEFTLENL